MAGDVAGKVYDDADGHHLIVVAMAVDVKLVHETDHITHPQLLQFVHLDGIRIS